MPAIGESYVSEFDDSDWSQTKGAANLQLVLSAAEASGVAIEAGGG